MRNKLKDLLDLVEKQLEISKNASSESRKSANEISAGLTASYSLAGDVEHSKNSANLSQQKYEATKNLFEELQESASSSTPNTVEVPCYVRISMSGIDKELYLVKNPVFLSGYNLISSDSPIGGALIGAKVDDLFLYKNGEQTFTGKILDIG